MGYYKLELRKSQYGDVWVMTEPLLTDIPPAPGLHPELGNVVAMVEAKEILMPMTIQVSRSSAWVEDEDFSSAINSYIDKKKKKENKAHHDNIPVAEVKLWVSQLDIGDPIKVNKENKKKWLKKIKKELASRKRYPKRREMMSRIEVVLK